MCFHLDFLQSTFSTLKLVVLGTLKNKLDEKYSRRRGVLFSIFFLFVFFGAKAKKSILIFKALLFSCRFPGPVRDPREAAGLRMKRGGHLSLDAAH